jgi:hypothetical protein
MMLQILNVYSCATANIPCRDRKFREIVSYVPHYKLEQYSTKAIARSHT